VCHDLPVLLLRLVNLLLLGFLVVLVVVFLLGLLLGILLLRLPPVARGEAGQRCRRVSVLLVDLRDVDGGVKGREDAGVDLHLDAVRGRGPGNVDPQRGGVRR